MSNYIESMGQLWGPLMVLGQIGLFTLVLLLSIAFLLLLDRKVWAGVMMRKGPNVVGPFGLLQSFADFGKFLSERDRHPGRREQVRLPVCADPDLYAGLCCLVGHSGRAGHGRAVPAGSSRTSMSGFSTSSRSARLGVYGIIMGGWASNSKYPFLGALRSAAQMVSYEVSIGLVIITVILMVGSMNLTDIVNHQDGGFWNWHVLSVPELPAGSL
jgi:NADH-quinone oxidoreductase subunit H